MQAALLKSDKILYRACKDIRLPELKKADDYFNYLVRCVVYQQLSGKAALTIYNRFKDIFGGEPGPDQLAGVPHERLRAAGLSNQKATYVVNIARFASTQGMETTRLDAMDDMEVINYLTGIKGVGRWTVEMMLIFAMLRPDVFPIDDLGIRQGMAGLYGLDLNDKRGLGKRMTEIAEAWRPNRSLATRLIYAWKDSQKTR